MDPPKPPKLTRPTMNKSSVELKQEITENLHFLQRQMEIHYGHRATFRSDATVQFLAKIVGLTRQLREQWTRYIDLDTTIRDEFPIRFPHRPRTEKEMNKSEMRRDDLIRQPIETDERSTKSENLQQQAKPQGTTDTNAGAKPKEVKRRPDIVPENDSTDESRKPRQMNMWSQRTTTTIFDGGRRTKRMNKQTQQASASYIQEQSPTQPMKTSIWITG